MKITWFGTATVALECGNTKIILDPFVRRNKKLETAGISDFTGYDAILVTHGHFDHLLDVPKVMKEDKNVEVYCTKTPRDSLVRDGVEPHRIHCVGFEDAFSIGDFTVRAHRGHHVDFNMEYILSVVPDCIRLGFKSLQLLHFARRLPEGNETIIYEIQGDDKTVLIMGSYGIDAMTIYPTNPDLLIFPFAGNSNIASIAAGFVSAVQPKTILFDHFDNAFPPLTKRMDVEGYCDLLHKIHPEIQTIVPHEMQSIEI